MFSRFAKYGVVAVGGMALLIAAYFYSHPAAYVPPAPQPIENPRATAVVATLESPIPEGKNAVWCASFLAAWKTLAEQFSQEPKVLDGGENFAAALSRAIDPRPGIPPLALYVAAGSVNDGVMGRIEQDMARLFPGKAAPSFPGTGSNALIAYAYLEATVKFSLPYFDNCKPLKFTDSTGAKTSVDSFGIRDEDAYAYNKLRRQPRVLFRVGDEMPVLLGQGEVPKEFEFALDLCQKSEPNQIVIARIKREPTLAAAIARVDRECKATEAYLQKQDPKYVKYLSQLGPNDVLLVPNFNWLISHRFSELEGKGVDFGQLGRQRLDVARQDIFFRLDRCGAELGSESKVGCTPIPKHFVLDRPFLIFMRKRGENAPYFAMWVDNAELLCRRTDPSGQQSGNVSK